MFISKQLHSNTKYKKVLSRAASVKTPTCHMVIPHKKGLIKSSLNSEQHKKTAIKETFYDHLWLNSLPPGWGIGPGSFVAPYINSRKKYNIMYVMRSFETSVASLPQWQR